MPDGSTARLTAGMAALVAAHPSPLAVMDEAGTLLAANDAFRAAGARAEAATRTPFDPGDGSTLLLVTLPDLPARAFDAMPVLVNIKDRDCRYRLMNSFQARLYGTTPAAAIGRTAGELLGEDYGAYTGRIDRDVMASGNPTPFYEETYATADGLVRRWLTCKLPLRDATGAIDGVLTVGLDITDRARLEDALRQAKEEAEAASRAKSGFLTAMSHELRTPLNAVIGFSEIMAQQALGPLGTAEYVDYAGHILSSGRHLLSLINDVLDYARIEAGSLVLNIKPVDLNQLLHGVLETVGRTAREAGVELAIDIAEQKVVLRADSQRLRQVMLNVAGNAVKFTPRGGRVSVTMRPDMRGGARIAVTDSGVGIAEADLTSIFQPFWQADTGLDRLKEGTGIGLPLARQLIALHGGRLELESRLGEGTRVTVLLPEHRDAPIGG